MHGRPYAAAARVAKLGKRTQCCTQRLCDADRGDCDGRIRAGHRGQTRRYVIGHDDTYRSSVLRVEDLLYECAAPSIDERDVPPYAFLRQIRKRLTAVDE